MIDLHGPGTSSRPHGGVRSRMVLSVNTAALRTLVVDDDRDTADTLGKLITLGGDDVKIAYDGRAAIEVARTFRPEIGLIDLQIPQLSGFRVAKELRELPELHNMLLVAVTGWSDKAHRTLAKDAGFDQYLVKPFSVIRLRAVLRQARELRQASVELRESSEQLRTRWKDHREGTADLLGRHQQTAARIRSRRHSELRLRLGTLLDWQPLVSVLASGPDCHKGEPVECWCSACVERSIHAVIAGESISDEASFRLLTGLRRINLS